jgi:hypothetical protein
MVMQEIKLGVNALFELSESELELELGRRLAQTEQEVHQQAALTAAQPTGPSIDRAQLQALPDFARKTAERFLTLFNQQMYSLICDEKDPDNKVVRTAAAQGAQALGYALSGVFIATFGWLPGIATVIAVIIAKRIGSSSHQALCQSWKEQF